MRWQGIRLEGSFSIEDLWFARRYRDRYPDFLYAATVGPFGLRSLLFRDHEEMEIFQVSVFERRSALLHPKWVEVNPVPLWLCVREKENLHWIDWWKLRDRLLEEGRKLLDRLTEQAVRKRYGMREMEKGCHEGALVLPWKTFKKVIE